MTAYLLGCTAIWAWLHVTFGRWGRSHRLAPGGVGGTVRICVPARDEAANISACVRCALADRAVTEVVVVDDASADDTVALALAAGAGDPRLTVRSAPERPEGWAGKPWAAAEAARGATTDWLVFVDADVSLAIGATGATLARAETERADLASLFGTWELVSFWERLAIPAIGWLIRSTVDLDALNADRGRPFANGQLIAIRRSAYDRLGGHAIVRAEILDDVRLAERARAAGLRIRLWWAPWAFTVRLYRSLPEIVAGYRKNLNEGIGRRAWLGGLVAVAIFAATAGPMLVGVVLLASGDRAGALWCGLIVVAEVALRARIERRDGRDGAIAVLHPLAGALVAAIFLLSCASPRVAWKGRSFVGGRATRP